MRRASVASCPDSACRPDLLVTPLSVATGERTAALALATDPGVTELNDNGGDRKTEEGISELQGNADSRGNDASYIVRRLKRDADNPSAANHAQAEEALGPAQGGGNTRRPRVRRARSHGRRQSLSC
jgi:hypothetical protein